MIKEYLVKLELRIQAIQKILGNIAEFKESDIRDVRDGISDVISKLHKDNSRKCKIFPIQSSVSKKSFKSTSTWWIFFLLNKKSLFSMRNLNKLINYQHNLIEFKNFCLL